VYGILPVAALAIGIINTYMISVLDRYVDMLPGVLGYKMRWYVDLRMAGTFSEINILNIYSISLLLIYYLALFNVEKLKNEIDVLLVKLLGITVAAFYALSFMPVLAFRVSGFIGVSIVLLLPDLVRAFKQSNAVFGLMLLWLSMNFVVQLQNLNL
jgi:hypothetical protein